MINKTGLDNGVLVRLLGTICFQMVLRVYLQLKGRVCGTYVSVHSGNDLPLSRGNGCPFAEVTGFTWYSNSNTLKRSPRICQAIGTLFKFENQFFWEQM